MALFIIKTHTPYETFKAKVALEEYDVKYDVYANSVDEESSGSSAEACENVAKEELKVGTEPTMENQNEMQATDFSDLCNVADEPENLGQDFLAAQLSTKHQAIIRNILAIVSAISVTIVFILEKLGIL